MAENTLKVCITGAAGQIGYSLIPLVASGQMLGADQKIVLALLDIEPCMPMLEGVVMEVNDGAYPLVAQLIATSDAAEALRDVDVAMFVGGFPRKQGMERKQLLQTNKNIFKGQGEVLNEVGKQTTKVLVVANPANTNCNVLSHFAPNIPRKNFTAMTRLDHNRAAAQVAQKTGKPVADVKNVIIWGNHSSTQYPDVNHGTIAGNAIRAEVGDDAWLNGDFITTIQKRGAAIIEARKASSAMSAAKAATDHVRDWVKGTKEGEFVSMAVPSDGSYGIEEGIIYSYPVKCSNGEYEIVQGLDIDEFSRAKMDATKAELFEEKEEAFSD